VSEILVRGLSQTDREWIEEQRPPGVSLSEFIRALIDSHRSPRVDNQGNLFESGREPRQVFGSLPFTFIDLFAGIGGFRSGLTALGGRCVYTNEWDKYSARTYEAWYGSDGTDEVDMTDIRAVDHARIPDHDILAAGFPCQPFSLAGVSKKRSLGRAHGFDDKEQGNLFFAILDVIDAKRPPVVFLENVKNLKSHDRGNTWQVIKTSLEDRGYVVHHKIIDAAGWVPQHRERIFVVCFDQSIFGSDEDFEFEFPTMPDESPVLSSVLEDNPDRKYMLSDKLWSYLKDYAAKHKAKGNGFGYGIGNPDGVTRTMSARYHKDGSEILIEQKGFRNPRRLTIGEARQLLGFEDRYAHMYGHSEGFPQVVSNTQAYRQFGNAVVPRVVEAVGARIVETITAEILQQGLLTHSPPSLRSRPTRTSKKVATG